MSGRHQPEAGADSAEALQGIESGPEVGGATRQGSPPAPSFLPPGVRQDLLATYWTVLGSEDLPVEDRALAYAVLHQVQLRINRALRPVKNELAEHMVRADLRRMGQVVLVSKSFDVEWPANSPDNWEDSMIQDAMAALATDPSTAPYITRVPYHLEVDTAALGSDVHAGIPQAIGLWRECADRRWRTEGGKRVTVEVRPAPGVRP